MRSLRSARSLGSVLVASLTMLAAAAALAQGQDPAASPLAMAVLGDSISTGAATHPALVFDPNALWRVFDGETDVTPHATDLAPNVAAALPAGLPPPMRLWPTPREFYGGPDWIWRNLVQSLSRRYLDTAQYSWSYLLAARLDIRPEALGIAAEDGSHIGALPRHVDRVLAANGGRLPKRVLIFYTGNDLCGQDLAHATSEDEFATEMERGLRYLGRNAGPSPDVDVYVIGFLSVPQLVHGDAILGKSLSAFGQTTTCRDLRAQGFRPRDGQAYEPQGPFYFHLLMPPNPAGFCPTLFAAKVTDDELGALANRVRGYRERTEQIIGKLSAPKTLPGGVRLHYVGATSDLIFNADDIAGDCFHLSAHGQARVADIVGHAAFGLAPL